MALFYHEKKRVGGPSRYSKPTVTRSHLGSGKKEKNSKEKTKNFRSCKLPGGQVNCDSLSEMSHKSSKWSSSRDICVNSDNM